MSCSQNLLFLRLISFLASCTTENSTVDTFRKPLSDAGVAVSQFRSCKLNVMKKVVSAAICILFAALSVQS